MKYSCKLFAKTEDHLNGGLFLFGYLQISRICYNNNNNVNNK